MPKDAHIQLVGKVAEIVEKSSHRYVNIVCTNHNIMLTLDDIEDVSLGDSISIFGKFSIKSIISNGIEIKITKPLIE